MGRTERLEQPQQFGKYELVARLAHGRMGDVYKAKSHGVEGFEKVFVVKVLNPALTQNQSFVDLVIEEAKRTVSLSHANVAQIFDVGVEEASGQYYIAQEYINGFDLGRAQTLGRLVTRPLPMDLGIFIASEIAKGLDYAHRRKDYNFNSLNLLHGDLSPRNIMLSFSGEVKITDFGMALALGLVPAIDNEDVIERVLYQAPEVVAGGPHTQKSDIFSLGLLIYELFSGRHPYRDSNPDVVRERALAANPAPLGDSIPRQLLRLLDLMLVPDPAGRTVTAGSIYEELVAYIFSNNLRADSRAQGLFMQELRREEHRIQPNESTQELGLEEISLADLQILQDVSEEFSPDETNAELPSAKIAHALGHEARPQLPGALEEYFAEVRGGSGKAVIVSGELGSGRNFLPDRLPDALGWRGSTKAYAIQTTPDDKFSPFGVLSRLILDAIGDGGSRESALEKLRSVGAPEGAVETLASLYSTTGRRSIGSSVKFNQLEGLFRTALDYLSSDGPLVIVVDQVNRLDDVSIRILRQTIGEIADRSLMLVLCTDDIDETRKTFDTGQRENLEVVRVSGRARPTLNTIDQLPEDLTAVVYVLAIAAHPMTQADLTTITGLSSDRVMSALRDLTEMGVVRVPRPSVSLIGFELGPDWVYAQMERGAIESWAGAIARHYKHRIVGSDVTRYAPLLVRLYAMSGDRRRMLRDADSFATWLEYQGWLDSLLDFHLHCSELIASNRLGCPQDRINILLNRADIALRRAQIDVCRTSLEPVIPLTEAIRSDVGAIRGQLLLGQMAMQQDDLVEAYANFSRAADASRAINDPDLLALGLLALARWHDRYGDARAGQERLEGAMNLFNRWGSRRMNLGTRALMMNRAVRLLNHRGMHTRAASVLRDLTELADTSGLAVVQCRALWAEGSVLATLSRFEEARAKLTSAQKLASDHGLTALKLELVREEAAVALDGGDFEDVITICDLLIEAGHRTHDHYSAQRGHDLRATALCMLRRDVDDSLKHLLTSLARARERHVPKDIYRCHFNLSRALRSAGRTADADMHLESAEKLVREMAWRIAA